MSIEAVTNPVERGDEALAGGDWQGARAAFEAAIEASPSARASEGLARALWWLHDTDGAISNMERAYAAYRDAGDARHAAASALWLAREFSAAYGHDAVSGGWLARAQGLLREAGDLPEQGWLELARAERSEAPPDMHRHARTALELARRLGDADLEAAALIREGYADVASEWRSDRQFIHMIEQRLPPSADVFQIPYVPFPEGALGRTNAYEAARGPLPTAV